MQSIRNLEYHQCRSCYDSTSNLQLLTSFVETSPLGADKTYAQLLLEVCNINVMNDKPLGRWPQFICFNCSRKLIMAYDFMQHTLKINKLLQSIADLMQIRSGSDFIEKPALDIPLEIKTEKDDELGSQSHERKFQYSPVEADNELSSLQTNEIFCNIPCSIQTSIEYKNNNKMNDENVKEILTPGNIEFFSNDVLFKDDLEKFHSKIINNMDNTDQNVDTDVEFLDDNLLCTPEIKIPNTPADVPCNECNETFPSTWKLNRHKQLSHASQVNKTYCAICSQNFSTPYNYRRHVKNVHRGKSKLMAEKKKVIQRLNYTHNMKINKKLNETTCNICEKTFLSHTRLARHKRYTHISDEEKITCNFCERKFARPDNYQTHMKRMHGASGITDIKPAADINSTRYCCTKCGRSYSRRILLFKHEADVHGNK